MRAFLNKPWLIFIACVLAIALPLFLFEVTLFDGEIIFSRGLVEVTEQAPLSLSYFIGLGYNEGDLDGIKDFYLLPSGYLLAGIFIFGFPGLIAYRVYLSKKNSSKTKN